MAWILHAHEVDEAVGGKSYIQQDGMPNASLWIGGKSSAKRYATKAQAEAIGNWVVSHRTLPLGFEVEYVDDEAVE